MVNERCDGCGARAARYFRSPAAPVDADFGIWLCEHHSAKHAEALAVGGWLQPESVNA